MLFVLGFNSSERLSLKAFRAGKATQMCKDGFEQGKISLAGEWRSNIFFRCVDTDTVDLDAMYNNVYASDDDE